MSQAALYAAHLQEQQRRADAALAPYDVGVFDPRR